jgi:hypothetical protein
MQAGLLRLGWDLWPRPASLPAAHGPLMVVGFLGTVISLERAVALGSRWAYAAPLLAVLSAPALLLWPDSRLAPTLAVAGSTLLVVLSVVVHRRQPSLATTMLVGGAAAWIAGNVLWLVDEPISRAVPWWSGFLVLTIAGERLELSRLVRVPQLAGWSVRATLLVYGAGLVLTLPEGTRDAGVRVAGIGLIGLALWLLRYDIARRTIRQDGLPRFVAACVLTGCAWLAVSGTLAAVSGETVGGARYDAMLHALFLGFSFALIFGHAPIILPAVTGLPMLFRSRFYAHLCLLHLFLLMRVGGDLTETIAVRRWGSMGNAVVLLLFLVNSAGAVRAARQRAARRPPA